MAAASPTPPAPGSPGLGPRRSPSQAFEDVSKVAVSVAWRKERRPSKGRGWAFGAFAAWGGGSEQEHSTIAAMGREGPPVAEHADLDEPRPRWAWTKVSGPRITARGTIDRRAAGLPSTREKPRRDNRMLAKV